MTAPRPGPSAWRRLVAPAIATALALAFLIGLGIWQLERKVWKEALMAALTQRLDASSVALPAPERWPLLDPARDEFRRVSLSAEFSYRQQAFVYTTGSAGRGEPAGPGYWVFTLAHGSGGHAVVVNRGFVPQTRKADAQNGSPSGIVDIVGIMRWPERRTIFTPADDAPHDLWFVRDHAAMATAKGWGKVAPFFVDLESPRPAAGVPRPGAAAINLRNDHLNYALTWFALALVLLVIFALWARKQLQASR